MEYFRPDVKVGVFIFVVLVLLVAGAITIGGVGEWFATTQEYTVLIAQCQSVTAAGESQLCRLACG